MRIVRAGATRSPRGQATSPVVYRGRPGVVPEPAQLGDIDGIHRVHSEVYASTYANQEHGISAEALTAYMARNTQRRLTIWRMLLAGPTPHGVFVVRAAGAVVGFGAATVGADRASIIQALYVLPGHQRRGIGSALLHRAVNWHSAYSPVFAYAVPYTPAVKFYERRSFARTGRDISHQWPEVDSGTKLPLIELCSPRFAGVGSPFK